MIPYIGHEFVEALQSVGADRPSTETPKTALQPPPLHKRRDRAAPFQRVTLRVLSRMLVVVTSKWMIYLIVACL